MGKRTTKKVRAWAARFWKRVETVLSNQEGVGTVEVVLLILVAVGLVLIFKDRITELVNSIFNSITSRAGKI